MRSKHPRREISFGCTASKRSRAASPETMRELSACTDTTSQAEARSREMIERVDCVVIGAGVVGLDRFYEPGRNKI